MPPKKQTRRRREDTKNDFNEDFGVNVRRKDRRPPVKGKSYVEEMKLDEMFEKPFEETEMNFCNKVKSCGHECDGVKGEHKCLPCLHPDCGADNVAAQL